MVSRVYENRTRHLIVFSVPFIDKDERKHKWYTVKPEESVEIEYNELEKSGPNSFEKAELFGLTLKKGSVQDIVKVELPPEALGTMVPKVSKKKGKKK